MSLDFWVRATVILAFSSILRLFFRSGRARSAIGHASLIGLVLLPAVSLAPRLSIPVLASESAPIPVPFEPTPPTFEPLPDPIFAPISPSPVTLIPETPIPPPPIVINWPLTINLIITFFLLLRLILSLIASIRLCRAGTLVDDPIWLAALDNARNRLKLSATVSLRRSHRIAIPVVIGWPRATILLPTNLADSVADAVLLHELAHVRRSDFAWNLLLRVVRAFYWPHPLVWLLSRSISVDRERACDALCIHELGGPPAYRAALISVASGLIRRPSTSIGIAMARTPRLALRLSWIDRHPGDPRCVLGLRGRIFLALTTLLVVGLIGTGEMTRAEARAVPQAPAEVTSTRRGGLKVHGVIVDPNGKPVPAGSIEYGAIDPKTGHVESWQAMTAPARGGVGDGRFLAVFLTLADAYRIRILVDGTEPFISRPIWADEADVEMDVRLVKPSGPLRSAVVLRPDGKPLARARVLRAGTKFLITMTDGQWSDKNTGEQTTGPDGSFAIPSVVEPFVILVLGDDAFALTNNELLAASTKVQAQPYGRVEGEFRVGDKPLANRPIELFGNRLTDAVTLRVPFLFSQTVNTDAGGHFVFDRIIPMDFFRIGRHDPRRSPEGVWTRGEAVDVRPGETTRVVLGGKGRAIVGRLARPDGVAFGVTTHVALIGDSPLPPASRIFPGKIPASSEDWRQWLDAYRRSPEVGAKLRGLVGIAVGVRPDGSFRIDDAPDGHYRLVARLEDSPPNQPEADPFACIAREVVVPAGRGGPIDLGTLTFRPHVALRVGEPAPALDVTAVDGRKISLADLRGKFVLLDFGAHYDVAVQNEVAQMHGVFEAFGKDDRLAIMSLVCESDTPAARRFVASKQEPWPQAIIGPLPNPLADSFGVEPRDDTASAFILVGPDGRIVARPEIGNGPQHDEVNKAVAKALGK